LNTPNHELIYQAIKKFDEIAGKYEEYQDIMGLEHYSAIADFAQSFKADAEHVLKENRTLKVGVVGQIKAGKSTFLNSLLFDGRDLLPEAATPMTAALTIITYADTPKAEIEFYTQDEWNILYDKAKRFQKLIDEERLKLSAGASTTAGKVVRRIKKAVQGKPKAYTDQEIKNLIQAPDDMKAAYELVLMAQMNKIQVEDYLGTVQQIAGVKRTEDLIGELQQYVGGAGKYTPIVKSTILHIPDENLRYIDIVDTPGINDPILSRGQRTREYLGKCDVIFLLSYSGQFMDSVDVELMTQNIPDKGIVNVMLIGSKFDTALLGDGGRYPSLRHALKHITEKLRMQAESTLLPVIRQYPDNKVMQSLKNSLPPIFISSIAYQIGKHMPSLTPKQEHVLSNLKRTFPNETFSPELLRDFSNIEAIQNKHLPQIRENKDNILKERFQNLFNAQEKAFIKQLQHIAVELRNEWKILSESSGDDIEKNYRAFVGIMEKARKKVDFVFDQFLTKVKRSYLKLQTEFKEIAQHYRRFDEQKESRREVVGTERYGFLWLKKREVYETRTYTYANVHQTIDQLGDFVIELEKGLKSEFNTIISMDFLMHQLKEAILGVYNLSDENFDFEDVIIPVQKAVNKISLPTFDLDSSMFRNKITAKFGMGRVEGGDVERLRELFYQQIDEVLKDVQTRMDVKMKEIEDAIGKISFEFIDDVLKDMKARTEKLQASIRNREENMRKYEQVISALEEDCRQLIHA
jgi:hypothetical protein